MRWTQTPYSNLAEPPALFDLSAGEWALLKEAARKEEDNPPGPPAPQEEE